MIMGKSEQQREPTAVEDVRAARRYLCKGGFIGLRDRLQQTHAQLQNRSGPFADLPTEQPDDVRQIIDAANTEQPLLDEIQAVRHDLSSRGTGAKG